MKLIKILALATAIATVAAAQNPGGAPGQPTKPSPTPAGQQKGTPAKTGPAATAAKANRAKAKPPATKSASAAATKGAVQTGVLPEKKNTTHKTAPAPAVNANKSAQAAPSAAAAKTGAPTKSPAPVKAAASAPAVPAAKGAPAPKTAGTTKNRSAAGPTAATAAAQKRPPAGKAAAKKTAAKTPPPAPPLKAKATATGPSTIAQKKPAPRLIGAAGRRDPFVSPIRNASAVSPNQNCTSGKRCLAIPELTLQGTVRDISGKMMAIVATSTHRTYTLRENDQVFNGSVEKITTDSIIFREYVKDAVGRESAKEVVKKMGPTS